MTDYYNTLIVGAGPAGIFTAYQLLQKNYQGRIIVIEKGKEIRKRFCPKSKAGHCVKCNPCAITTGFSGAGAFSDGKLSLSPEVGGDFPELVGYDVVENLIDYTDNIYKAFGADWRTEGVGHEEEIKTIRKRAINADLKLVECPIRHLGTEKAQEVYTKLEDYLRQSGVNILFDTSVEDIIVQEETCKGVRARRAGFATVDTYYADNIIIATGRRGAEWLFNVCNDYNIQHQPGTVDIGVRVECRNEVIVIIFLSYMSAWVLAKCSNFILERLRITNKFTFIKSFVNFFHNFITTLHTYTNVNRSRLVLNVVIVADIK